MSEANEVKWCKEANTYIAADCDIEQWRCKGCGRLPEILELPDHIDTHRKNRKVSIDYCVAEDIKYLWDNGVQTLSVCYGHKEDDPSIVIDSKYTYKEIDKIVKLLEDTGKEWEVHQWQIIEKKRRVAGKTNGEEELVTVGKVWI